ncbi:MAG: VOC family protein [Leptospiraceae bacterium]|nr:VOC family protein [Leptospiraceae bacterium]
MILGINHMAIASPDPQALARFYTEILQLERIVLDPDAASVWLRAGTSILMIEDLSGSSRFTPAHPVNMATKYHDRQPGFHALIFAIEVDTFKSWKKRIESAGVQIEAHSAYSLYFRDPEKNRIGLSTYPQLAG